VCWFLPQQLWVSFEHRTTEARFNLFEPALPQRFENVVGDDRIANGTDAPQGKYPSMVALYSTTLFNCGGTILNEYWLLTAAVCVEG
jgi:secreted trypsin-like serine protease